MMTSQNKTKQIQSHEKKTKINIILRLRLEQHFNPLSDVNTSQSIW